MNYTECQKDIIKYILKYYNNPDAIPIPNEEVLSLKLEKRYPRTVIKQNIAELLEKGILITYSSYKYLDLTDEFKETEDYEMFLKNQI